MCVTVCGLSVFFSLFLSSFGQLLSICRDAGFCLVFRFLHVDGRDGSTADEKWARDAVSFQCPSVRLHRPPWPSHGATIRVAEPRRSVSAIRKSAPAVVLYCPRNASAVTKLAVLFCRARVAANGGIQSQSKAKALIAQASLSDPLPARYCQDDGSSRAAGHLARQLAKLSLSLLSFSLPLKSSRTYNTLIFRDDDDSFCPFYKYRHCVRERVKCAVRLKCSDLFLRVAV